MALHIVTVPETAYGAVTDILDEALMADILLARDGSELDNHREIWERLRDKAYQDAEFLSQIATGEIERRECASEIPSPSTCTEEQFWRFANYAGHDPGNALGLFKSIVNQGKQQRGRRLKGMPPKPSEADTKLTPYLHQGQVDWALDLQSVHDLLLSGILNKRRLNAEDATLLDDLWDGISGVDQNLQNMLIAAISGPRPELHENTQSLYDRLTWRGEEIEVVSVRALLRFVYGHTVPGRGSGWELWVSLEQTFGDLIGWLRSMPCQSVRDGIIPPLFYVGSQPGSKTIPQDWCLPAGQLKTIQERQGHLARHDHQASAPQTLDQNTFMLRILAEYARAERAKG